VAASRIACYYYYYYYYYHHHYYIYFTVKLSRFTHHIDCPRMKVTALNAAMVVFTPAKITKGTDKLQIDTGEL